MMDSNLPQTRRWPLSCHLPRAIAQSIASNRCMGKIWFTGLWMINVCSWWYQSTILAVRILLLCCTDLHMLHILVLAKYLLHCSNISCGQACNKMFVSMLLVVLYAKGLRMLTKHLQGCCSHCQYLRTSSSIGP